MSIIQSCHDTRDCVDLFRPQGLYLKPIARINVSVQLPALKKSGAKISNWEVMEKVKEMARPFNFPVFKVSKSSLEFIRFEAEIENYSTMENVLAKLDMKTIKLSGFHESLKVRAAEAKPPFPTRHDWDSFFRENKTMNDMKAGERPDTIHFENLPSKWFVNYQDKSGQATDKPSEFVLKKAFATFGEIRIVDIPMLDPYRSKMKKSLSGISTFTFGQDLVFEAYIQYKEYIGFVKAMNALRGMKLLYKDRTEDRSWTANVKVDFDQSKHLADSTIKKRKVEREKIIQKPGQMFPYQNPSWPGQGGNGDTWYPGNMGPPGANHSPHHRALPAPLTFDSAYNFAGQQMTMEEFPTQHPYSNHESPLSHRSPAQSPGIVPVNGLGVSSTRHHSGAPVSETKELGPGMLRGRQGDLPSDSSILLQSSHQRPPDPSYHPPFNLPQEQPHFLAFSAAGVPVTSRAHDPQASERNNKLLHPDPNIQLQDSGATPQQLTRTPAAPREDKSNPTKPPPQAHPTFSSSNPAEALPPHHASEQVRRQQELSKNSQINMQKMAAVRNLSSSGDQQGSTQSMLPVKKEEMGPPRTPETKLEKSFNTSLEKSLNSSLDSTLDSSMLDSTMESSFNDSVNSPGRSKGPGKNDITKDAEGSSCRTPLEIYNETYDDFNDQERSWVDAKVKDLKDFQPPCDCGPEAQDNGPYYTHLGHAATGGDLRKLLETRLRVSGSALRMEKIRHTGIEGKTREDCPIAKWILRRGNLAEKFMCVWKERPGHMCEYAVTVTALICWDALSKQISGRAYDEISSKMASYGCETERQCGANKRKTCACQGLTDFPGASYTYGCSWSMYQNCCKFSRSQRELVRKFRTTNEEVEWDLEQSLEDVTDQVAAWHEMMAPDCFKNMTLFEEIATDCRVGRNKGQRPYSGITTVVDFCAHSHKDTNNMVAGTTAIVSLTRPENRKLGKQEDEQFHVLPLYVPDMTQKEIDERVANGQLEVLQKFHRTLAIREKPMMCAKRGRPTMEKKKMLDGYVPDAYDPTAVFGKGEGSSPGRRMSQSSRGGAGLKFESADDGYIPENMNGYISGDLPVYSYPVSEEAKVENKITMKAPKEEWSFQVGPTQPKLPKPEDGGYQMMQQQNHNISLSSPFSNQPRLPQLDGTFDDIIPQLDGTNDQQRPYTGQEPQYYQYGQPQQQYYPPPNYNYMIPPQYNSQQNPPPVYHPPHAPVAPQPPTLLDMSQGYGPGASSSQNESLNSTDASNHLNQSGDESSKIATSSTEEELKAEEDIYFEETDCSEAFMNPEIGGVALALPHGSLCLEVAKNEVHATTALKYPNKKHPCRIGLVFYQHKNLHFPEHGVKETQRRQHLRDVRDYKAWLDGTFVPTSRKVQQLQEYGFIFPENVKTVDRTQEARPEDYYKEGDYPGFKPNFPDDILADKFALSHAPNIPVQDEIELKPTQLPEMTNGGDLRTETDSEKLQNFVKSLQT